jgi:hypothetical protein
VTSPEPACTDIRSRPPGRSARELAQRAPELGPRDVDEHLAPTHSDDVEAAVEVRIIAVEQPCRGIPLYKHGCMPWPALHPDVVDREMEIGQDAADALQPALHGFFVVALTTNRVGAGKAVMDIRRYCFNSSSQRRLLT